MDTFQKQAREFQLMAGQPVKDKPTVPDLATRILGAKILLEECLETINAMGVGVCNLGALSEIEIENLVFFEKDTCDLVCVADGTGDSKFVANWIANAFGIDLEAVEAEICRSNLTKLWTREEVEALKELLGDKGYTIEQVGTVGRCYRVKNSSGKLIKSPSYSPANLGQIIEAQMKGGAQ